MIHDSLFDIKDDEATKLAGSYHYRIHPDVYLYIGKLRAVAHAAERFVEVAPVDMGSADGNIDFRALEAALMKLKLGAVVK